MTRAGCYAARVGMVQVRIQENEETDGAVMSIGGAEEEEEEVKSRGER